MKWKNRRGENGGKSEREDRWEALDDVARGGLGDGLGGDEPECLLRGGHRRVSRGEPGHAPGHGGTQGLESIECYLLLGGVRPTRSQPGSGGLW